MATDTRIVQPGDPYADPPRNWRRVGVLAGSWLVLFVVVGMVGWVVMSSSLLTPEDGSKGSDQTPREAVESFLRQAYGRGEIDSSQTFVCDAPGAPDAQAFRTERDQLEATYGPLTRDQSGWIEVIDGDHATVRVRVTFENEDQITDMQFSLEKDGGWRICGYSGTDQTPPKPSSS